MLKIGLTGNIGCGKSSISKILADNNFYIIDADKIARTIYSYYDVMKDMKKYFSEAIVDGEIDRKKLGQIVFSDKEMLDKLNSITHCKIKSICEDEIASIESSNNKYNGIVVDAALLYEAGFDYLVDVVVVVYLDKDIQIERVIKRDGLSREDALKRIESQMSQKEKMDKANFVINNSGTIEDLKFSVLNLIDKLKIN